MATAAQIAANRRNALKSTGPKTEEGKSVSRLNAVKHGLASVHAILPHEDGAIYHAIRGSLLADYAPANTPELLMVDQIAQAAWCMQRADRLQLAYFNAQIQNVKLKAGASDHPTDNDDFAVAIALLEDPDTGCPLLERYAARASSRYFRATDSLRKMQNDRRRRERELQETYASEMHDRARHGHELASICDTPIRQVNEPGPDPTVAVPFVDEFDAELPADADTQNKPDSRVAPRPAVRRAAASCSNSPVERPSAPESQTNRAPSGFEELE